jgi:photosystem II stability/assembly factor-like uncharacterized protein
MTHEHDPLTEALRDSLHRHAAEAPDGTFLVERILATAERAPDLPAGRCRNWRTWTLPLIAAGAVAAVVGSVVGIASLQNQASPTQPGTAPATVLQTPPPTQQVTSTPAPTTPVTTSTPPPVPTGLSDVRIADLTFVGDDTGWALGSADCLSGTGRCTALWRTSDGHTWTSMAGAAFNTPGVQGCADPCVHNIRFANDRIGYAFGPSAFFLTTDGGASWQQLSGGAIALETLDDNVIRVTSPHTGCPSWCDVAVETAAVGSNDWTPAALGDVVPGYGVQLVRGNGGDAYLLFPGHRAGGGAGMSVLYRSTDSGRSWSAGPEPCPQRGQEVDSVSIAAGADGRVSVLCATRQAPNRFDVASSDDAGATFTAQPGRIASKVFPSLLTGDAATVLVAAGNGMARSTDGGASWQQVDGVTGDIGWVGFESQTVGRAVSADGSTIWTTRDGGISWRPASVG